jgi:hypothetical protein
MKLKKAAKITATPGVSTRVETTVAMELAAMVLFVHPDQNARARQRFGE